MTQKQTKKIKKKQDELCSLQRAWIGVKQLVGSKKAREQLQKAINLISLILVVILFGLVALAILNQNRPVEIYDLPKLVILSAGYQDHPSYNFDGNYLLSTGDLEKPVHEFIVAGDRLVAKNINLDLDGNVKIREIVLTFYLLPPEFTKLTCYGLPDENNGIKGESLGWYPLGKKELFKGADRIIGTPDKKGVWKILTCVSYRLYNETTYQSPLMKVYVTVLDNYDLATLQYSKKSGEQNYFILTVAILTVLINLLSQFALKD